jgi:hypothetical protein
LGVGGELIGPGAGAEVGGGAAPPGRVRTATVPKAPPAPATTRGTDSPPTEKPLGRSGSTAAGPVDEIAATTGAWHSSAERTTRAAWSGVRVESMLGVITST